MLEKTFNNISSTNNTNRAFFAKRPSPIGNKGCINFLPTEYLDWDAMDDILTSWNIQGKAMCAYN